MIKTFGKVIVALIGLLVGGFLTALGAVLVTAILWVCVMIIGFVFLGFYVTQDTIKEAVDATKNLCDKNEGVCDEEPKPGPIVGENVEYYPPKETYQDGPTSHLH